LGHGPVARLGELFLARFCYGQLIRDGLMRAALYEVDGKPVGFVAYTDCSITFHRTAIKSRLFCVAYLMLISLLRRPRLLLAIPKAMWLMLSRRAEIHLGSDPLAEVVGIGVLPEYRAPGFVRKTGLRISEELIAHAGAYFRSLGLTKMRMIVEANNKQTLVFYHCLGATFEPYQQHGEPMVLVWFDLSDEHGPWANEEVASTVRSDRSCAMGAVG
jgi:ribosomal protein S18 acetylase RimI-like enzyme